MIQMKRCFLILIFILSFMLRVTAGEPARLLRFPDIHQDKITFVYAGDIWIVNSSGGVANRLTSHKGMELFPKFSPDGQWIAFSAEYTGNRQVYVISVNGGQPKQLTWYNDVGPMPPRGGYDYQVLGWTPDGKNVLFRGNRLPWGVRMGRYYTVPVKGGMETPLQIPEGGGGMLSPDGSRMVYTPIARAFRTWKRHRGGRAQDIWIYNLKENTSEQITDFEGTDNQPVWINDRIYFTSDRDFTLNLFEYNTLTKTTRKVTNHNEYDVLWPSAGPQYVVYECGGFIYKFNPATVETGMVPIEVFGDFPATHPYYKNVSQDINWADISPTGKRALFEARGDIFTVPAEKGEILNLTQTPGIREINPVWSPDKKWIAYWSDKTGEYELFIRNHVGSGSEKQITQNGTIWRFPPVWSPDSKKLAYSDHNHRLFLLDAKSGEEINIDHDCFGDIRTYTWSPDSRWLAYVKTADNRMNVICIYSLDQAKSFQLTDAMTDNFNPVFDPKGRYLYFLSNRDYNLTFSDYEFTYLYTDPTRVYVATLSKDIPRPFIPDSDHEIISASSDADKNKDKDKESGASPDVKIDIKGFENRISAIPGSSGQYNQLSATDKGVLYLFQEGEKRHLKFFDIEEEKEETILEDIRAYELSDDRKKLLYMKGRQYGIVDAKPNQKNSDGHLKLDDMKIKIDPRAEWKQIFTDGWRLLRDWFYDPGMHGMDWNAMREKYEVLVPYVAHRADLDHIFGELGGELNSGHVYVGPGDYPEIERIDNGLLGAELTADASGYYKITKIFPGENWHNDFRSPLTEPGVHVKEGDFLLAVNGHPVHTNENPYRYLENKAGHIVTLTVNNKPSVQNAREEKIRPVQRETNLRYLDWIESRRKYVEETSGGRIGYIHLPNTAQEGNRELFKYFYPQTKCDALIIDVRYNGGGFIPERMIELLDRPVLNYWTRRNARPVSTPGFTHQGPKVCLINAYSSSGGDAFPYYFRKRGLGTIIGTRTWGGLIGLSGNPGFMDGGAFRIPTFRFLATDGHWDVENVGVSPDIEVLDRPDLVAAGKDPSLEKAVEILLGALKEHPPEKLIIPDPPDLSQ